MFGVEARDALADAAQLLAPGDAAFRRAEALSAVTSIAHKLAVFLDRPERRTGADRRAELEDLAKLGTRLARKLHVADRDGVLALNGWRWLPAWGADRLNALAIEVDQLAQAAREASQQPELSRSGRGVRPGVIGTPAGWLAREVADLVKATGHPLTISRDGTAARVAALIWQAVTGADAPETVADRCKEAARLLRLMDLPSASDVMDESTDRRRGHDLEEALDAL